MAKETKLWVIATDTCRLGIAGGDWKGYLYGGFSTIADTSGKYIAFGRLKESDIITIVKPGSYEFTQKYLQTLILCSLLYFLAQI